MATACWILCTPRTGSSLLCELLNNLNVYPAFQHPDLQACCGLLAKGGSSFNEWIRLYAGSKEFLALPPAHGKMIFHQYVEVLGDIPKKDRYNIGWYDKTHSDDVLKEVSSKYNSRFVRSLFPDIKFIHLTRNPLDQAVSLYTARSTKKYHIYNEHELQEYLKTSVKVFYSDLFRAHQDAVAYGQAWKDFWTGDESIYQLKYGSLIEEPIATVKSLMEFLEVEGSAEASVHATLSEPRYLRMSRPQAAMLRRELDYLLRVRLL